MRIKKTSILFLITTILVLNLTISTFGQKTSLPKWIEGTWHNPFESNTNRFVFWTFYKDSIFIGKGLMGWKTNRKCLNTIYKNCDKVITSTDSTYKVSYIKNAKSTTVYAFKRFTVDYSERPVLTYIVIVDGVKTEDNSLSINSLLTK